MNSTSTSMTAALLALAGAVYGAVATGAEEAGDTIAVSKPATPAVFEGSLLDLPPAQTWQPGMPLRSYPRLRAEQNMQHKGTPRGYEQDPLLQRQSQQRQPIVRTLGTLEVEVEGLPFGGGFPDDINGDVGRDFFIQSANSPGGSIVRIFNKADGTQVGNDMDMKTIAAAANAAGPGDMDCATGGDGDPIVLYDDLAGRWLFTQFEADGSNKLCVYVARSSDVINGGFFIYAFQSPDELPDYPKFGVWPNAYYAGTNENTSNNTVELYAFERSAMLAGNAARFVRNTTLATARNNGFEVAQPVHLYGTRAPAANAPGLFLQQIDDELFPPAPNAGMDQMRVISFLPDFANPGNSTVTEMSIPIAEFDSAVTVTFMGFGVVPQPNTPDTLDPLIDQVMNRAGYRNFGTHESIVGTFAIDTDGNDLIGTRWFELRRTPAGMGNWTLFQEGTVPVNDGIHRWNAGIAQDAGGNIALGYATSNGAAPNFPGLSYTGRLVTDALGMLAAENRIEDGVESQTGIDRWGDYASMSMDPVTGCRFWFTGGYMSGQSAPTSNDPAADGLPGSRIAAFRVFDCVLDFGDAPDDAATPRYPTLAANDGGRHWVRGPRLGNTIDNEADGAPSANADGDGADEDGVTFTGLNPGNAMATLNATVTQAAGRIDAWIDFNNDGDWADANEQILDDAMVNVGANALNFAVPAGATTGDRFARVRLSSAGVAGPNGVAPDGEVEDQRVTIADAGAGGGGGAAAGGDEPLDLSSSGGGCAIGTAKTHDPMLWLLILLAALALLRSRRGVNRAGSGRV